MSVTTGVICVDVLVAAAIALLNVPAFTAVCPGGAWDAVPQGTPYPYAQVSARETPTLETFSTLGFDAEMRLHLYSSYQGTKELDAIAAQAALLLHHGTPVMVGWVAGLISYAGCFDMPDLLSNNIRIKHRVAVFPWLMVQS
jgi:hypothetical protein